MAGELFLWLIAYSAWIAFGGGWHHPFLIVLLAGAVMIPAFHSLLGRLAVLSRADTRT